MEYEKNADGTDKLDEQGNPIPVKITNEKEKEVIKINEELVEQIKDLRLKLGVTEGLLKDKEQKPPTDPNAPLTDEQKIELILDKKFKEQAMSSAQANKKAAFEKFITESSEFNPENDPTGLKKDALLKKVERFNTEGLTSVEEFYTVIKEAKILLLGNDSTTDTSKGNTPYSNPQKIANTPPGNRDQELTPKELKLAQQTGKSKEQILKLKLKNPEYFAGLLQFVRD